MPQGDQQQTGASNELYNLVSLTYHLLEGAKTYAIYAQDAKGAGDQELAQFFS